MPTDTITEQENQFVFRRLEEALRVFGHESDPRWFWIGTLVLVLAIGFLYVGWMYKRDSRTVGWGWASLLGLLRCTVYAILAGVFLLPALQTWERTELHSKVVTVMDVSDSMKNKDDLPTDKTPVDKLPSRQDKVIAFLTQTPDFLKGLEDKNPLSVYRFGSRLDSGYQLFEKGRLWTPSEWSEFLKPNPKIKISDDMESTEKADLQKHQELLQQLVNGTNLPDSLIEVVNHESNNMVQGIIVFSDGRTTLPSSDQAIDELRRRARRSKIPIFTVAVGDYRQPISIKNLELQAPEQARPDDKFPVRIEVDGEGLPNKDSTAFLDIKNPRGEIRTLEKPIHFSAGSGGPPHAQVEFEIDAALLGSAAAAGQKPELEEGEWILQARVPKDRREIFLPKEHSSDKQSVRIIKKPLRVLLFAGAASKEYQFVRNMLVRAVDQHQAELSICLQSFRSGIVQDVPNDRLLTKFPYRLGEESQEKAEDRFYNLSQYDLVIAFDPDWTQLEPEQVSTLEKWVNLQAGGIIFVAGPVNTYQLARLSTRDKVKPILDMIPVILQDSTLSGLGLDRPTTEPWRLNFPGATSETEFLNLDEESKERLSGWEEFFTGKPKSEVDKTTPLIRGFYSYYPVDKEKPSATVVATFGDPRARVKEGTKEQPFLVTMPYGSGKIVYLGSGEMWRLRTYKEIFHERFWTKLARYAGSGNLTRLNKRGNIVMSTEFPEGQYVRFEAQLFGRDMQPLSPNAHPKATFKSPAGVNVPAVEMAAKKSGDEWGGWFTGQFRGMAPGEYRIDVPVPDGGEVLSRKFRIKETNAELDNTRPDFGQLYQLASPAGEEVLPRLDRTAQQELTRTLEDTAARVLQKIELDSDQKAPAPKPETRDPSTSNGATSGKEGPRLFFDLSSARLIPKCMVTDSKVQRSRGPVKDLWDQGFTLSEDPQVQLGYVLLVLVILLSIEWLTRKLLRLA